MPAALMSKFPKLQSISLSFDQSCSFVSLEELQILIEVWGFPYPFHIESHPQKLKQLYGIFGVSAAHERQKRYPCADEKRNKEYIFSNLIEISLDQVKNR